MVTIHGKEYITVAERLTKIHAELKELSITTEVLFTDPRVVIKATVITPKGTFTGISAANVNKAIEKESPYEVAESSAVGRALAFAGYETTGGIASAEEMKKAITPDLKEEYITVADSILSMATIHGEEMEDIDEAMGLDCTCGTTNQFHAKTCPKYHI